MDFRLVIGFVAGFVSAVSGLRYIYAILLGSTKPSRVAWWVMTLICGMNVFFSLSAGATAWTMPVISFLTMLSVAILSLWRGEDIPMDSTERVCLTLSLAALTFYVGLQVIGVEQAALWALFGSLAADFFGFLPMVRKSWKRPETEDALSWNISLLGVIINFGAIHWDQVHSLLHPDLVYNGYILVMVGAIVYSLMRKRPN